MVEVLQLPRNEFEAWVETKSFHFRTDHKIPKFDNGHNLFPVFLVSGRNRYYRLIIDGNNFLVRRSDLLDFNICIYIFDVPTFSKLEVLKIFFPVKPEGSNKNYSGKSTIFRSINFANLSTFSYLKVSLLQLKASLCP